MRNQLVQERNGDRNERKNSALSINENEKNKNSGRLRERAEIKEESSSRLKHPIRRDKKSVKSTQGSSQKSTKVGQNNSEFKKLEFPSNWFLQAKSRF